MVGQSTAQNECYFSNISQNNKATMMHSFLASHLISSLKCFSYSMQGINRLVEANIFSQDLIAITRTINRNVSSAINNVSHR